MTSYEKFIPTGDQYTLKDPNYPDPRDGFLIIIPVYSAVPLGEHSEDGTVGGIVTIKNKKFCSLGKAYNHFVVDIQEMESRLDPKVRKADFEAVLKDPQAQPFGVWDSKGDATSIPRNMFADPTSFRKKFKAWDKAQEIRWKKIFSSIDMATSSMPYSVYARFIQPPVELGIKLYFTPDDKAPIFKSDELRTILHDAFASEELSLPQYPYEVLEWNEPSNRNPKLQLVGSHYLGFYHTWMSPTDFEKLWVYKHTPDLIRPWPDHKAANDVDLVLHKGIAGERDGEVTTVNLSHYKATEAVGKRGLFPGQKEVQGASATDVATEFWKDAVDPKNRPSDAEWLHRNAFRFGGLEEEVDLGSSQNRRNLIFGTGECNTHMIRTENVISRLLAADTEVTQDNKRMGTLVTTNVWTGNVSQISASGVRTDVTIPTWVNEEKYMWLSLNLKYVWTMKSALKDKTFNTATFFDPFSRYIPLRVEARLDDVLMDKLLEQSQGVDTPISINTPVVNNSVRSNFVSFALRAEPGVVPPVLAGFNREPMLTWHAIRAELPFVTIGGVKLRNPVVAQPPHELGRSAPVTCEPLAPPSHGTATQGTQAVTELPCKLERSAPVAQEPLALPSHGTATQGTSIIAWPPHELGRSAPVAHEPPFLPSHGIATQATPVVIQPTPELGHPAPVVHEPLALPSHGIVTQATPVISQAPHESGRSASVAHEPLALPSHGTATQGTLVVAQPPHELGRSAPVTHEPLALPSHGIATQTTPVLFQPPRELGHSAPVAHEPLALPSHVIATQATPVVIQAPHEAGRSTPVAREPLALPFHSTSTQDTLVVGQPPHELGHPAAVKHEPFTLPSHGTATQGTSVIARPSHELGHSAPAAPEPLGLPSHGIAAQATPAVIQPPHELGHSDPIAHEPLALASHVIVTQASPVVIQPTPELGHSAPVAHGPLALPSHGTATQGTSVVAQPPHELGHSPPVAHEPLALPSHGTATQGASVVARPPHELGRSAPVAHEPLTLPSHGTATQGNEVIGEPPLEAPLPIVTAPDSLPPPSGFVLEGDITLFGVSTLTARLEVWEGPPPAGVFTHPDEPASVQRATLGDDFHFSSIISALEGSPFDKITFRNATFYHQNYLFDPTKALGWHFNADWVVDDSAGTLHDVLSRVLGVNEPVLNIHAGFGTDGGWDKPFEVNSFTLEGVFAGISATPVDGLVLTRIGVRLFGIRSMEYSPEPHSVLEYGFGVFGSMSIDVPGSVIPLDLNYEIQEFGGTLYLSADLAIWNDPLGAKGITLLNTSFSTSFSLASPWRSFAFDVATSFQYRSTSADFTGSYAPGGVFELSATVYDFNTNTINDFFEFISDARLSIPEVDVTIGTATVLIGSEKGLDILLQDIDIGGYKAPEAALAITSHSVLLRGDLASGNIEFGDIRINRAFLQVLFETTDSGKTTDVIIGGQVTFTSLTFDAAVHLYPAYKGKKEVEWTVLAALTVADGSIALSKIVPEVSGTFLDLSLTQVTFVAASKDDPSLGNMITSGYEFHRGVQVCATLSQIDALDSLMRGPVPGLVLSAGWSKVTGFELDVLLPAPTTLNLGNGVTTTPFKLGIRTSPVQLILSAGVKVPVAYSPDPLIFTLSLGTNLLTASATGELAGWWVNPFGISENVKVGPNLALSINIILAQFVSTGTPSGFGVRGGLVIGKTEAQLALIVNEDPMKELLSAEVKALNLTDVVSFAEDIIGVSIPEPPSDFLDFEDVKLYICPAGVTLGTITYPQGFSFMADMVLFGKRADIACAINDGQVTVKGGVDNFELGPLTVRGTTGPRALVDCSFGPTAQHVLIDGVITLFDAEAAVHIEAAVIPEPKFLFYTFLKFTDLLTFQINAELIGSLDFKSLQSSDFTVDARLEQHILQYIHDQLILQFDKAREVAEHGINSAQSKLDAAQKVLNDGIDKAQADLDAAYARWDATNKSVTDSSQRTINAYNTQITRLQADIDVAQADFNAAMENAQHAVQGANIDRAQRLAAAQHAVDDANIAMVNGINHAQGDLDRAVDDMNRRFGSAQRDIENARSNVQSLQNQINDLQNTVRDYENAPWYEFWKKGAIGGLEVSIGVLEASKAIADGVLRVAGAVLTSTNYLGKEAAIGAARGVLNLAKQAGSDALGAAKEVLNGVDTATRAAVNAANEVLEATQNGVEFVALEGTKEALEVYREANTAVFEAAIAALEGLLQSVEYLAYLAATVALDIARGATIELEAAKAALELAREATQAALSVAKWVVEHGTQAFDIRVVHLSGSLRGIVGIQGATSRPLTAHIEGVVVDQPFALDGEFDPRKTADFITAIFRSLWNDIEKLPNI